MENQLKRGKECIGQEVYDCNNEKGIIIDQHTDGKKSIVTIQYEDGVEQIREKYYVSKEKFKKPYKDTIEENLLSGEWKYIPGFNNRYIINKEGKIQSTLGQYQGKILQPSKDTNGYPIIVLQKETGKANRKLCRIHSLMALTFLRPLQDGEEVNHIDGNKENNALYNLEIVSRKENNMKHLDLNQLGLSPTEIEILQNKCLEQNMTLKELLAKKIKEEVNIL
jgi:hypothetical protein